MIAKVKVKLVEVFMFAGLFSEDDSMNIIISESIELLEFHHCFSLLCTRPLLLANKAKAGSK